MCCVVTGVSWPRLQRYLDAVFAALLTAAFVLCAPVAVAAFPFWGAASWVCYAACCCCVALAFVRVGTYHR